jgi:hypothetical protein
LPRNTIVCCGHSRYCDRRTILHHLRRRRGTL